MKGLYKWYMGLTPLFRGIVVVGLLAILIGLLLWIKNLLKTAAKKGKDDKAYNDDIKNLTQQGMVASFPETTYDNLADRIEGAAQGFAFGSGTDEEAIKDVFKELVNDLDAVKLEKAFGARAPADCWAFCDYFQLGAYLAYEMSAGDLADINKILSAKGIKIRV